MRTQPRATRNPLLLLPVAASLPGRVSDAQSHSILLADALLQEVVRIRPVKQHAWSSFACLESLLVDKASQQGRHRLLVLPWCLPQETDAVVACARNALQRSGADLSLLSSSTLKRPEIAAHGVLPTGPLGGFVPPQPRLDRLVERWPGWTQEYTLLQTARMTILVQHPSAFAASACVKREEDEQLEQLLWAGLSPHQPARKALHTDATLARDGALYARYLRDLLCAACDLLSLPSSSPNVQVAEEMPCQT